MNDDSTDDSETAVTRRDWLSVTGAAVGTAIVGSSATGDASAQESSEPRINLGDNFYIDDIDGETLAITDASNGSTVLEYDSTAGVWTLPAVSTGELYTESRAADIVIHKDDSATIVAAGDSGRVASGSDATPVIEDAVASLPAARGKVYIAAGEYPYTPPIEITEDNVTIEGAGYWGWDGFNNGNPGTGDEGVGKTKLKATSTGNAFHVTTTDGSRTKGIELQNLYLYGNSYSGAGVLIDDFSDQPVIEQLFVHNHDVGIDMDTDTGHVNRCTLMDLGSEGIITRGYQGQVEDCCIYDVGGAGVRSGAEHCQIRGNQIGRTQEGIVVDDAVGSTHGAAHTGEQSVVLGNVVRDNRSHGILLSGNYATVVGNDVYYGGEGSADTRLLKIDAQNIAVGLNLLFWAAGRAGTGATTPDYAVELTSNGSYNRVASNKVANARGDYGSDIYDDSGDNNIINGIGSESTDAEEPQFADWRVGDVVDFTDTGDDSGTGIYQRMPDGTWTQIS